MCFINFFLGYEVILKVGFGGVISRFFEEVLLVFIRRVFEFR